MSAYLTLGVDHDVFAIPVSIVQEILDVRPISRLPHAPPAIAGMIDVRGRSVVVLDLRLTLGLSAAEPTDSSRFIILDPQHEAVGAFGLIADRVHEVSELDPDTFETAPDLGTRWDSSFIEAVGRWRQGFVLLLNLRCLLPAGSTASPCQHVA